jgi:hypothetical protein
MTAAQLASAAYKLGVIDNAQVHLNQLSAVLTDIGEDPLAVKLELTVRAFDERASEHRSILNQYANEITIDSTPSGQGGQTTSHEQENL